MHTLFDMYATGQIKPYISKRLPLEDAPAALAMVGGGKSTGKVVLQT
jgi:NADPH:quinone reductase-like Zn-dependent oxidoreductase